MNFDYDLYLQDRYEREEGYASEMDRLLDPTRYKDLRSRYRMDEDESEDRNESEIDSYNERMEARAIAAGTL